MTDLPHAPTRHFGLLRRRKDLMSSQESTKIGRDVSPDLIAGKRLTTEQAA
ncbi:hypothetical protein [Streptomyces sp. NPDC056194]|uniref:hypothetical protein n=1 Tax=unclassified Streptomyces TaxID=2593676 RepID=UPI0035E32862